MLFARTSAVFVLTAAISLAQPRPPIALVGPFTLIMLPISLWRLVFNGRCAQCGLRSGETAR